MSINVLLRFETKIDLECLSENVKLRLIRLLGTAQFQTSEGWSREFTAIIDTGSPFSVIPRSIWSGVNARILLPHKTRIFGLGPDEEGGLSGKLGEVVVVFKDKNSTSSPISFKAHLLDDDSAPFIIGFEDVLTEAKLVCDYKQKSAYLEF